MKHYLSFSKFLALTCIFWNTTTVINGACNRNYAGPPGRPGKCIDLCVNGTDGINGTCTNICVNGTNGTNGQNGTNGINGTDEFCSAFCVNGTDGTDGRNGTDGANATCANPCHNGTDGRNGTDGINGTDGTNATCASPCHNGTDGTNGTNGRNGTNGTNSTCASTCINGTNGANGTDGTNGTNGICTVPCVNGTNGRNGRNGTDGTNATCNNCTKQKAFGTWFLNGTASIPNFTVGNVVPFGNTNSPTINTGITTNGLGVFTIANAGTYLIAVGITLPENAAERFFQLQLNGVDIPGAELANTAFTQVLTLTTMITVAAGDTVRLIYKSGLTFTLTLITPNKQADIPISFISFLKI